MVTFPKYESYKDSGVEWLGEIPSHWDIKKLKYIIQSIETGKREQTDKQEVDDSQRPTAGPADAGEPD